MSPVVKTKHVTVRISPADLRDPMYDDPSYRKDCEDCPLARALVRVLGKQDGFGYLRVAETFIQVYGNYEWVASIPLDVTNWMRAFQEGELQHLPPKSIRFSFVPGKAVDYGLTQ